jgi:hypothetical protein
MFKSVNLANPLINPKNTVLIGRVSKVFVVAHYFQLSFSKRGWQAGG